MRVRRHPIAPQRKVDSTSSAVRPRGTRWQDARSRRQQLATREDVMSIQPNERWYRLTRADHTATNDDVDVELGLLAGTVHTEGARSGGRSHYRAPSWPQRRTSNAARCARLSTSRPAGERRCPWNSTSTSAARIT